MQVRQDQSHLRGTIAKLVNLSFVSIEDPYITIR